MLTSVPVVINVGIANVCVVDAVVTEYDVYPSSRPKLSHAVDAQPN